MEEMASFDKSMRTKAIPGIRPMSKKYIKKKSTSKKREGNVFSKKRKSMGSGNLNSSQNHKLAVSKKSRQASRPSSALATVGFKVKRR
jgi:hypothetical protein